MPSILLDDVTDSDIESNDHLCKVGDLWHMKSREIMLLKFNPNASEFKHSIESAALHNARDGHSSF